MKIIKHWGYKSFHFLKLITSYSFWKHLWEKSHPCNILGREASLLAKYRPGSSFCQGFHVLQQNNPSHCFSFSRRINLEFLAKDGKLSMWYYHTSSVPMVEVFCQYKNLCSQIHSPSSSLHDVWRAIIIQQILSLCEETYPHLWSLSKDWLILLLFSYKQGKKHTAIFTTLVVTKTIF